ncbi:P-loop containing nucleoside triphosphate hydrolase protein [Catenaria anguillulae PL171]|uniref:p-loop containing nucleoside triphosphate hydrolase protein n=1 Tax=Catenaria anguillulae PL171 TaxID=765915 RepID=A0A1Y2HW11_9FUNG|nr:P-loop containing nucleoside triphosphate hydrolase protein [Catenaria anguillulae PL171]
MDAASMAVPCGALPEEVSLPFQRLLKAIPYSVNNEFRDLAAIVTRDIYQENPGVYFKDIAGLEHAKSLIKEAVVFPIRYPELFQPADLLSPWRGVLLHGPPGTGKTLLAKAVATECKTTFFHVSASSLVSKWRGDSEKLVRVLFELARHHAPSTIFLDEVESLMGQRGSEQGEHEGSRRMKTELLVQLDGMTSGSSKDRKPVFFLAATNMPWELDLALLRRLEKRIFVDLPDRDSRRQILERSLPLDATDALGNLLVDRALDYDQLADLTEGFSGSDLRGVAKEALMIPLRSILAQLEGLCLSQDEPAADQCVTKRQAVTTEMVLEALKRTRMTAGNATRDMHCQWAEDYGCM